MNLISQLHNLTPGCREFQPVSLFPLGANTFDYSGTYKLVCNKTDPANAALAVYDLGFLKAGARVALDIEARCVSGSTGTVTLESRGAAENLVYDRKLVALDTVSSSQWVPLRLEWIVAHGGQFLSSTLGGSTASIGVVEFRNARFRVYGNDSRAGGIYACNLLRSGGVWTIDTSLFHNIGTFKVMSTAGGEITLAFKELEALLPVPLVSADTGNAPASTGFVSAGPHTITKNSMKIRLLKADGTFVPDVTVGGDTRINVALHFQ